MRGSWKKIAITALLGMLFAVAPQATRAQQFSEWSAPVNLGPIVNSPWLDQGPTLSRKGLSLFFVSDRPGGLGGTDIWVSQRATVDSAWDVPQNLGPNFNSPFNESAPSLSTDEHRLYFSSIRPGSLGYDFWVSKRHDRGDDFGWKPAEILPGPVNTSATEACATFFEDDATGTVFLYFYSDRPGGKGATDIYVTKLQDDETFGPAVLVEELSTPVADTCPTIRRDGLEIVFQSNRPGTFGGMDLWVATRGSTSDPWSTPVNLGSVVNSTDSDFRAWLSFDGTELYFSSSRPGGFGNSDIYVSRRSKLKE
jgi:hypothetical protein